VTQPHYLVAYLASSARERGISLAEVERQAGLGANTTSRWMTTGRTPDLDAIAKALKVLGLRIGVMTDFGDGKEK
jgi:DNA-binding phage protein